ncbi:MAG: hypothetical protein HQL98_14080 [Magnetococcales bacterium]|nr:hypothetical protein [Magnetococcales bacterium]
MKLPRKLDLQEAKRILDWFESPDVDVGEQLVQVMQKAWMPIGERHPRPNSVVLVSDGQDLALGRVNAQGLVMVDRAQLIPTHWLPLPPPPAPVENNNGQSIFRHNKVWRKY